jgi:CRISPR system Cascade subunit CasE
MTMTAAVLQLDRAAVQALRITDPYSLHRVVYGLFPDVRDAAAKQGSTPSGILYVDKGGDARGRKIILLADRPPLADALGSLGTLTVRPVPTGFLDHQQYRFEVVINPTRRENASRKLVPLRQPEQIADWFCQTAARSWGFAPQAEDLSVEAIEVLRFCDKNKNPVTLARAQVRGSLTVTDTDHFHHSFQRGIGRGRAFGCGLLQIIPIVDTPFA